MKKIILGVITLLTISCNGQSKTEFSLSGLTSKLKNGTVLYIKNTSSDKTIDSAIVMDNSFNFQTKLSKTPLQVVLHNKNFTKYRFLWLENNSMTFNQTKKDINVK